MCFTRSANPSGSAGSLGKGAVDESIGDRGSTDGANCVGSVVVLDSENPRGEDVLAAGVTLRAWSISCWALLMPSG